MLKPFSFLAISCMFSVICGDPTPPYPQLYRDYVFTNLSDNGRAMFNGSNPHPLCAEKKGLCMPIEQCTGGKMLYLTRVCYTSDLVCCYERKPSRLAYQKKNTE